MNALKLLPLLAAPALLSACATDGRYGARSASYADDGWGYYDSDYYGRYGRYDYNNPDPAYGGYDAGRYYREDRRYRERALSRNDRVYRGEDGRYYCRRSDGTTGLVVGAVAGGALGAIIAGGNSGLLGAVIGGAAGAAIGASVDKGDVRCR